MRWTRTDWLLLIAITLLGASLRFYNLGVTPPGFQFDEAFNAIDAEQVLDGNRPIFLPANGGREVLYTYFQAGLASILGANVYTFRLASALWGTAGVAAAYLLFRGILRRNRRLMASFAATALAISYWHIHFSHFGIRVIMMPVLFSALFGCYWAAGHAARTRTRIGLYGLAGLIAGGSVYANPTARFVPLILVAYTVVVLWREPAQRRLALDAPLGGLLLAGVAAFVVFLPLGLAFYEHPQWFLGHASEVSVFAARVNEGRGPLAALADNLRHVLGMFSFYGDGEWTHGMADRPLLDWAIAIPFYIGLIVWGVRLFGRGRRDDLDGDALWLLLLWMVAMLAPSVLSDAAPNFSRTLPSLPASITPIALGLAWIVLRPWPRAWIGYGLAGALMVTSLAITAFDYFVRFPARSEVYYAFDVDKADALAILRERGRTHQVYLSPLWGSHAPVRFLREGSGIKTLDTADTLVFPPDRGAVYAFTGEETARAERLVRLWPGHKAERILDKYGVTLITLVTIDKDEAAQWPAGYAPQAPMEARFDDGPTLLGMQASGAGPVNLFWRAEAPTYRDLTTFLHLIDAEGNKVAQADRIPGDGSYPTYSWSPGERVIDRLYPALVDACAGGESVRALAGWYQYAADGARRPRLGAPGDAAVAGEFALPVVAFGGDDERPLPAFALEADVGDMTLTGFSVRGGETLQPGSPFSVDLHAHAEDESVPYTATLALDGQPVAVLALGPTGGAQQGDNWCQRVRGRVPMTAEEPIAGELALTVVQPDGSVQSASLGTIDIGPSTRRIAPEVRSQEMVARFGEELGLVAAQVGEPRQARVEVRTGWQALVDPTRRAVAFLQLLNADGALVAQADGVPGGYATNLWVTNEVVDDVRTLEIPADAPAGVYTVVAGLYDDLSLERLPASLGDGSRAQNDAVVLGSVEIEGETQ